MILLAVEMRVFPLDLPTASALYRLTHGILLTILHSRNITTVSLYLVCTMFSTTILLGKAL